MNATVDDIKPTNTTHTGKFHRGDNAYIYIIVIIGINVILIISLAYVSRICKRFRSSPPPTISFGTTISFGRTIPSDVEADNHQLICVSRGLDDDVLVTFPTFLYAEVKMAPHTGDTATDANASSGSICLGDYKPADVVRLLPECDHFFHIKCVDAWLRAHPTCPMCRNPAYSGLPQD